MSDYMEVLDETDPGSILDRDILIHTGTFSRYLRSQMSHIGICVLLVCNVEEIRSI